MTKKYPSLDYPNSSSTDGLLAEGIVEIQEKVDGANFRFALEDGELVYGSRNQWGEAIHEDQFEDVIEYIEEHLDRQSLKEYQEEHGSLIVFGEAMLPHQIDYDDDIPTFIGFDVWSEEEQEFLHPHTSLPMIDEIGFEPISLVDQVHVDDWEDYDFEVPQSTYYDGEAEGVVLKNLSNGTIAKYVSEEFRENKGKTPSTTSETDRLAYTLIAESRVKDKAWDMVYEGEYDSLQMELMAEGLPGKVIRDAVEEEFGDVIMEENLEIDTAAFRSAASSRCASVLRDMMQENIE